MIGINHLLSGGIIGATVASPAVIPLAFASHFVMDALPHHGIGEHEARLRNKRLVAFLLLDVLLVSVFAIWVSMAKFDTGLWIAIGALAAVSPDLAWVYKFSVEEKFGSLPPTGKRNRFNEFHARIQKFESGSYWWIEIFSLVVLSGIFVQVAF